MNSEGGVRSFDSFATSLPKGERRNPITHTQAPVTTGTSIIAFEYDGGILMAADMLGSYGSLARYRSVPRLLKVNDKTVIGCMGDYADFQYLQAIIEQMEVDEACKDDGFQTTARSLHSWLTRVLYNKRCKFDPLWTTFVVAGLDQDKPFLGFVDKLGTAYTDPIITTGYASMLATPLIRKAVEDKLKDKNEKLTLAEARKVIEDSLTLMYYRDARASNKYQIAIIPSNGEASIIEEPKTLLGDWSVAHLIK
ncbi:Proteasome subunit beta type-4 [Folsomia candida]|uniref:Proteasome subunit beta n=2 Tax=Folsomia candida TaxID=158441 RepID=A0A226E3A2_FOLCA|nr:Proteasome subunit beta type-4 [Folsomia candida]